MDQLESTEADDLAEADTLGESVSSAVPMAPPKRGTLIGRYVVLDLLGAGAMGVVLAAYDPELDRKIALKLIKSQGGDPVAARLRLQREAQALAKLDHPNVVGVHDVGVHANQLFVGMEFVVGQTLGSWIESVEEPRPWREVVRVFIEAGRGLAAAHGAGLVHRDFKPDNVMLGDDGRVRVMDFGLARADELDDESSLDDLLGSAKPALLTTLTQTGALIGTPAYMALEQYKGQPADMHSDQFAFCVALYQALYGERPYPGIRLATLLESLEAERINDPPRGSSVPSWLRKVVVRGLAKDPAQRWPSMEALLEALAHDPALRRRKWWMAAGMTGFLGGAAWVAFAAADGDEQVCTGMQDKLAGVWDDTRRAEVEAAILASQLGYAPSTWTRVEQGLDAYANAWVAAREDACEATHRGEQSGELLDLRMACLDDRLAHLRAAVDELVVADERLVGSALSLVLSLPDLDRCADTDALMADVPPPEDPTVAARVVELDEQLAQAWAKQTAGKFDEAVVLTKAVLAEAIELDDEPLKARTWWRQGACQWRGGHYEESVTSLTLAYDAAVAREMTELAASVSNELVFVLGYHLSRHEDARRWAVHADPLSRAVGTGEFRANYLMSMGSLAVSTYQYEEALGYMERALILQEESLGPDHPNLSASLSGLLTLSQLTGKPEAARKYAERALALDERLYGPHHANVGNSLFNMGTVASEPEESRGYLERALAVQERAMGPDHPDIAKTLSNLGSVANQQGKHEEARRHYERALLIREKALGPGDPRVAYLLLGLGEALLGLSKVAEAIPHFERALAICTTNDVDPMLLAKVRKSYAGALWDASADGGRDRVRARELAEQARASFAQAGDVAAEDLANVEAWLAQHVEPPPSQSSTTGK